MSLALGPLSLALSTSLIQLLLIHLSDTLTSSSAALQLSSLVVPVCARILLRRHDFSIAWRAAVIGTGAAIGMHFARNSDPWTEPFGWYLVILAFFHLTEYLATALTNPGKMRLFTHRM